MRSTRPIGHLWVPLALFAAALVLYLNTLTEVHTFDALSYVTSVERKPWTEMFHPHHLAYGPLGALAHATAQLFGWGGGAALPMQLINAVAGALGVALFFSIVRRLTGQHLPALVAALLLGGSYAYWYYAVEIEVYTVATLFLLICLDLLVRIIERPTPHLVLLLGLAQGGAVLFHQTNVLFCVPACVVLLRRPGEADGRSLLTTAARRLLAYGMALSLSVALPYLLVGFVVSGFSEWQQFVAWLTEYARTGWWGGPITSNNWASLGQGLAETLAQPGGTVAGLLLLGLLLVHARRLGQAPRVLIGALVAWLLVYGGFFFWWEPDNIEFWIASLPPALLLLALALNSSARPGPGAWAGIMLAAAVIATNYGSIERRGDASTDLQRTIARALAEQSAPADLLLVPDGLVELYLPYYEARENFLSLNQALFDAGGDWEAACTTVRQRANDALHAGARVIIADEVLHPPEELLDRFMLAQTEVEACFAAYQPHLRALPMPEQTPLYWRLTTAQELAEGTGWHFDGWRAGWKGVHIAGSRIDTAWRFVPRVDPALTSPLLRLEAEAYSAIEIRLSNATTARDAQLFYAGADGQIDEERSLRWELAPGSDMTSYTIDLRSAPGWEGTITRLRLDPVGVGDGREIAVERIRLIGAGR